MLADNLSWDREGAFDMLKQLGVFNNDMYIITKGDNTEQRGQLSILARIVQNKGTKLLAHTCS